MADPYALHEIRERDSLEWIGSRSTQAQRDRHALLALIDKESAAQQECRHSIPRDQRCGICEEWGQDLVPQAPPIPLTSKQQAFDAAQIAFERWHVGISGDASEKAKSWKSGYASALLDQQRAPETSVALKVRSEPELFVFGSAEATAAVQDMLYRRDKLEQLWDAVDQNRLGTYDGTAALQIVRGAQKSISKPSASTDDDTPLHPSPSSVECPKCRTELAFEGDECGLCKEEQP